METGAAREPSGHAFICYASEDSERVAAIERVLVADRIRVWQSASSLRPGDDWRIKIRNAIEHDCIAFLACFSTRSTARKTSFQNDELLMAIDEVRSRQPGSSWLIPVRLDDCQIPRLGIGGDRTLASIQRADLFGPRRAEVTAQLIARIREISSETTAAAPAEGPAAEASPGSPAKPGWVAAIDVLDRTYQEWIGWAGTLISPVAMSSVLHLDTDPGVAAVYLSRVPVRKAARMLAASPAKAAGEVLKRMESGRATAILKSIPADSAQAIVETM